MDRKEVIIEAMMWLLSTLCGVSAIGMAVGLHLTWIYEPNVPIRTFETMLFMASGIMLCLWSFIRFAKKYVGYNKAKGVL